MAKKVSEEKEVVAEEVTKVEETVKAEEKAPKKCGNKKVLYTVIALVAAAIIGLGVFFAIRMLKSNDPVKITSDAIRGLKDTVADVKEDNDEITKIMEGKDPYEVETKINVKLPENMGKYSANILAQIDEKNEEFKLDLSAKAGKEELIALNTVFADSKLYFKLPDTMKTFYSINLEEYMEEIKSSMAEVDTKKLEKAMKYDYSKLFDYLADAIDDTFTKDDFKKTSEEITVDGKDKNVKKYTVKVTNKDAKKIIDNFLEKVLKDKELLEVVSELSGEEVADIKDAIKEVIDTKVETESDEYILYSVYVSKTGKVLGCGFEVEEAGSVTIIENGDTTEVTVTAQGISVVISIEDKGDDHKVITASTMGVEAKLDIKSDTKTIKKNKEYKETVTVDFSLNAMGQSMSASLEAVSTIKKIDSIDKVKNAIDVEKMTDAEQTTFLNELSRSKTYKTIEQISKALEKSNPVTNYSF